MIRVLVGGTRRVGGGIGGRVDKIEVEEKTEWNGERNKGEGESRRKEASERGDEDWNDAKVQMWDGNKEEKEQESRREGKRR